MDAVGPIEYHSQCSDMGSMEEAGGKEAGGRGIKALLSLHCHCELKELDSIKL